MKYVGTWVFHSIAAMNDDESGFVYLSAEDYLKSPMPYVDETDEDAVADEMKERKKMVGMQVKICEDGKPLSALTAARWRISGRSRQSRVCRSDHSAGRYDG